MFQTRQSICKYYSPWRKIRVPFLPCCYSSSNQSKWWTWEFLGRCREKLHDSYVWGLQVLMVESSGQCSGQENQTTFSTKIIGAEMLHSINATWLLLDAFTLSQRTWDSSAEDPRRCLPEAARKSAEKLWLCQRKKGIPMPPRPNNYLFLDSNGTEKRRYSTVSHSISWGYPSDYHWVSWSSSKHGFSFPSFFFDEDVEDQMLNSRYYGSPSWPFSWRFQSFS